MPHPAVHRSTAMILCSIFTLPQPFKRTNARLRCIASARMSSAEESFFDDHLVPELMRSFDRPLLREDRFVDWMQQDMQRAQGMNHVHPQQATGHSSIYRYESNRHGSYRYESVMLWSSCETRPCAQYTEQQSASGGGMALVCGGAVAALYPILGAIFWGRYSATCFEDMAKWQLTLLWPFLYLCNSKFRKEFNSVFQDKPNDGSDNVGQVSEAGL